MRRLIAVVVLLLMFAVPVLAADVIRSDPNTPGAQPVKDSQGAVSLDTDSRLDIRITYEAQRKPVRVILQDLSSLSGVALYSGYNNADWQVRDRRMNVFAKDVPLRDLMRSISRVMKFKWRISTTEDSATYRLIMDRLSILEMQNLLKKQDDEYHHWMTERRQVILNRYASADKLSDSEIQELKQSDPQLYYDIVTGVAKPLAKLMRELPELQDALLGSGKVWMGSELTSSQQQALLDFARGISQQDCTQDRLWYGHERPDSQVPDSIAMDHASLSAASKDGIFGCLLVCLGGPDEPGYGGSYSFLDNDDEATKYRSRIGISWMEGDKNPLETARAASPMSYDEAAAQSEHVVGGEDLIQHPDDPSLLVKKKVEPKSTKLRDVEKALNEASAMAVVSDDFGGATASEGGVPHGEVTIKAFLDGMSKAYCYNWDKHANVIELWDRMWFKERSEQVPDEWIERWKKEFQDTGTMDVNSLVEMAALSEKQFDVNIKDDDVLSQISYGPLHGIAGCFLSLYGKLSDSQRAMLFSQDGLDMSSLPLTKRMSVQPSDWIEAGLRDISYKGVTLYGTRMKKGKVYNYSFTMTSQDPAYKPLHWNWATPEYNKPKKEDHDAKTESN